VLMDLLWSDPTTNDGVQGVQPSPRGPGLVTFGPDRVKEFCKVRPVEHCGVAGFRGKRGVLVVCWGGSVAHLPSMTHLPSLQYCACAQPDALHVSTYHCSQVQGGCMSNLRIVVTACVRLFLCLPCCRATTSR
jgi:hypothetical protein